MINYRKRFKSFAFILFVAVFVVALFAAVKPQSISAQQPAGQSRIEHPLQASQASGKLRSCQTKEQTVKRRVAHLLELVTEMETKFDTHVQRVETFYTSKVVPSGKTVPNYNSLASDIQTKKSAVQTSLINAQTDAASFSCTASDPKTKLTQFRQDMQAVKATLKEYRTSIKNLIVAVRSVTGQTQRQNAGTPKPER